MILFNLEARLVTHASLTGVREVKLRDESKECLRRRLVSVSRDTHSSTDKAHCKCTPPEYGEVKGALWCF